MALTKITSDIVESNIQQSGFKNKIIGGDFSTNPWQRGTTFNSVANNTYTADRWQYNKSSSSVVSIFKTSDSPTVNQAGVYTQHCLHVDVLTAEAINSSSYAVIEQKIEGINIMPLGFGQPGSRFVTLSFWHKHTKTGSYSVSLSNSELTRSYVRTYNQAVSNVWQKSTITIPVDIEGTWLYDNGIGLRLRFCVASGSTFQTTSGTWVTGNFLATSAQVNGLDSTSNNFKIALVQLEFGSNDSRFESRSVGQELVLCQRYFEYAYYYIRNDVSNGTTFGGGFMFSITKRGSPTLTILRGAESGLQSVPILTVGTDSTTGFHITSQATATIAVHLAEGRVISSAEL